VARATTPQEIAKFLCAIECYGNIVRIGVSKSPVEAASFLAGFAAESEDSTDEISAVKMLTSSSF
jgi:hypothetical protein